MPNPPVLINDFDSLNAKISAGVNDAGEVNYLKTDPSGTLLVSITSGIGTSQNVNIVGSEITQSVTLAGSLVTQSVSLVNSQFSPATYVAFVTGSVIKTNKSMIALFNSSSTSIVKVKRINLLNIQVAAIVGVVSEFRLHRITTSSIGTSGQFVVPVSYDSQDILPAGITLITSGTVTESTFLKRQFLQTDESVAGGGTDLDLLVAFMQNTNPFYSEMPFSKQLILRQNEGIHVRHATASILGNFDIEVLFTVEYI